jgi:energy-coupling factor transport system permease protein
LDVRTKTLAFLMMTVLVFLFSSPVYNLALTLVSLSLTLSVGLTFNVVLGKVKPLVVIFLSIIVLTGISYAPNHFVTPLGRSVIGSSFGLFLTVGGLLYGLTYLLRILVMVLVSSALIYCTPLDAFLELLRKLKMPYQLAFVLTTAIRFVPTMEKKTESILDAQRARGSRVGTGSFMDRIRTYIPVMVPMMVEAVRMSEVLAVAMLNRGYGASAVATPLRELKMETTDYLLSGLFVVGTLGGVLLRLRGYGQL